MEIQGSQQFASTPGDIWEAIFDPTVMEQCIPGAEAITRISEREFEATIVRGVASITVTMDSTLEIEEDNRPDSIRASLEGSDNRVNSTVNGTATIELEETADGTVLEYDVDIQFTGKLASLGGRIIKRQMKKDLDTFFSSLQAHLES